MLRSSQWKSIGAFTIKAQPRGCPVATVFAGSAPLSLEPREDQIAEGGALVRPLESPNRPYNRDAKECDKFYSALPFMAGLSAIDEGRPFRQRLSIQTAPRVLYE